MKHKQIEKHDFFLVLNTLSIQRLIDNQCGVWKKDVLGGYFLKKLLNKGVNLFGNQE